jgi:apolipoprotein N-acyltransferase
LTLTGWRRHLACFFLGAALALAQAPTSLFYIPLLVLPCFAWLGMTAPTRASATFAGWVTGVGYFAFGLVWLVEPFLVDAAETGWMAPFALFLMSAGLALFWAMAFWLAYTLGETHRQRVLALVVFLGLAEFARAHLFTGFPWNLIAYGWIDTPVAQLLSLVGPHGLGLLTMLVAVLPLLMVRMPYLAFGPMLALIVVAWAWGAARMPAPDDIPLTDTTVRIIQPNAAQELKWREDMVGVFFDRQLSMTRAPGITSVDVVIWPETGLPFYLGEDDSSMQRVVESMGPDAQLIAGIRRYEDGRYYNSLVHMDAQGEVTDIYDKHHLVPFGEYYPFASLAEKAGLRALAAKFGGFSGGSGPRILTGDGLPPYLPMICYEAIFPGDAQAQSGRPDWLVHITNDAWFGKFSGPYQHLVQVRARAIEQGLPVARSANTGVSGVIGPHGRMLWSLPLGEAGSFDARLPAPLAAPPYVRWGEWPWVAASALLLAGVMLRRRLQT